MSPQEERILDKRKIRKVVIFYEDDTREPTVIDGSGMIKQINTTNEDDPVSFYTITITPSANQS